MSFVADNVNGQATMANSKPVVIASDQSTLPVSAATLPLPSGAASDQSLNDLSGLIRMLMMQINSPAWLNIANNGLQTYSVGGTISTVTTVTTVTTAASLTNMGANATEQIPFNESAIQWATSIRNLLT